jgi:hypothetical protein
VKINSAETYPSGWYRNTPTSDIERYWDGRKWTGAVKINPDSTAPVASFEKKQKKLFFSSRKDLTSFTSAAVVSLIVLAFFLINTIPGENRSLPLETTQATPAIEEETEPVFNETPSPSAAENCKVPDARINKTQPSNVGFPILQDVIPAQGVANIIVAPISFLDAPGINDESAYLQEQVKLMEDWAEHFSNGKLTYTFQLKTDWIQVPTNSSQYEINPEIPHGPNTSYFVQQQMAQDIVNAASQYFDFGAAHGMLFLFPPTIQGVVKDLGGRGVALQTPSGTKEYFFWGGGQYHHIDSGGLLAETKREKTWAFWIHEMLHSQGLSLHAPGNGFQTGLHADQYGQSLAIDAWESFLAGWISDENVYCVNLNDVTTEKVKLSPLETKAAGKEIIVIRLSEFEAIAVESRRSTGFSEEWPAWQNGLLAYRINTQFDNDRSNECCGDSGNDPIYPKWSYMLLADGKELSNGKPLSRQVNMFMAMEGESITSDGIRIKLVHSGDQDYVEISKVAN